MYGVSIRPKVQKTFMMQSSNSFLTTCSGMSAGGFLETICLLRKTKKSVQNKGEVCASLLSGPLSDLAHPFAVSPFSRFWSPNIAWWYGLTTYVLTCVSSYLWGLLLARYAIFCCSPTSSVYSVLPHIDSCNSSNHSTWLKRVLSSPVSSISWV